MDDLRMILTYHLWWNIEEGNVEKCRDLIRRGAYVNKVIPVEGTDPDGRIPLHLAIRNQQPECIRILLEAGAYVNSLDGFGRTPLYLAAGLGYIDGVKILLDNGADINYHNSELKFTALHCAAFSGYSECVEFLINKGADTETLTIRGQSAEDLAMEYGHIDVINIFNKYKMINVKRAYPIR